MSVLESQYLLIGPGFWPTYVWHASESGCGHVHPLIGEEGKEGFWILLNSTRRRTSFHPGRLALIYFPDSSQKTKGGRGGAVRDT